MRAHRFGRKLKLLSITAIKHQILMLMLEDEIKAIQPGGSFYGNESVTLEKLRRLISPRPPYGGQG